MLKRSFLAGLSLILVISSSAFAQDSSLLGITLGAKHNDNVNYNPVEEGDSVFNFGFGITSPYTLSKTFLGQFFYSYKENTYQDNEDLGYSLSEFGVRYFKKFKKSLIKYECRSENYGDKYYSANNWGIGLSRKLSKKTTGKFEFNLQDRSYSKNSLYNAQNTQFELEAIRKLGSKGSVSASYKFENHSSYTQNYTYKAHILGLGYNHEISEKIEASLAYQFRLRDFEIEREDKRNLVNLGVTYKLKEGLALTGGYLYLNNDSDSDTRDYKNNIFSFGLRVSSKVR